MKEALTSETGFCQHGVSYGTECAQCWALTLPDARTSNPQLVRSEAYWHGYYKEKYDRLRAVLRQIASAGEIHDPHWAGDLARKALYGNAHETKVTPEQQICPHGVDLFATHCARCEVL